MAGAMIVLDSGLGGICVARALRIVQPGLHCIYVADNGGFPYGSRTVGEITTRAEKLVAAITAAHPASALVLACNTLSTLCLDHLRDQFPGPFVGTVPAIKTAARDSRTRRFTLLATPNTAHSSYTNGLIEQFAKDCVVDRYGAPNLASYAERMMLGETIAPDLLRAELLPAFADDARGRTDSIVLGCTHFPLVVDALRSVSPWEVQWIDSSAAIARHALKQASAPCTRSIAYLTDWRDIERYRAVFQREGFADVSVLNLT